MLQFRRALRAARHRSSALRMGQVTYENMAGEIFTSINQWFWGTIRGLLTHSPKKPHVFGRNLVWSLHRIDSGIRTLDQNESFITKYSSLPISWFIPVSFAKKWRPLRLSTLRCSWIGSWGVKVCTPTCQEPSGDAVMISKFEKKNIEKQWKTMDNTCWGYQDII